MTISFNTATTATASAIAQATAFTFTVPLGVLTGDVMVVSLECFTFTSAAPAIATPTSGGGSWTQIDTLRDSGPSAGVNSYATAWQRTATAGDPGSTFTVSFSGTVGATNQFWWAAVLAAYTGCAVAPVDVASGAAGLGSSVTLPTLLTTHANDWALYLGEVTTSGGGITGPVGATSRGNVTSAANVGAALFDSAASVGGSGTSIGGGTYTAAAGSWFGCFTVGLAPFVPPVIAAAIAATSGDDNEMGILRYGIIRGRL